MTRDEVTAKVATFYDELPFNYETVAQASSFIRRHNQIAGNYPDLDSVLEGAESVLDVGCGAGWFSNTSAYHYDVDVRGIDISRTALDRAIEISHALGVAARTHFERRDLFTLDASERFDVVCSIGVLHHTDDLAAALEATVRCVRSGGALYLGLYHARVRKPFLEHFADYLAIQHERALTAAEFEEALMRYRELDRRSNDDLFARSWFRDQVLHPHETQHTLDEVACLLDPLGLSISSTSINRFQPFARLEELFPIEEQLEQDARQRLEVDHAYVPGFFTVLARRE